MKLFPGIDHAGQGIGNIHDNENRPDAGEVVEQAARIIEVHARDCDRGNDDRDNFESDDEQDLDSGDESDSNSDDESEAENGIDEGVGEDIFLHERVAREGFKNGDLPLYDGAPITLSESVLSILALSFAHNLSGSLV